jgi:hypothetical protein
MRRLVIGIVLWIATAARADTTIATITDKKGRAVMSADGTRVALMDLAGNVSIWDDTGTLVGDFPRDANAKKGERIECIAFDGTTLLGIADTRVVRFDKKPRVIPIKARAHPNTTWVTSAGHLYITRHIEGETTLELLDIDTRGKAKPRSLLLPYEVSMWSGIAVTRDGATLSLLTFNEVTHAHVIDTKTWKLRSSTTVNVLHDDSISTLSDDGTELFRGQHAIELATGKSRELLRRGTLRLASASGATVFALFPDDREFARWTPTELKRIKLPAKMRLAAISDVGRVLFCGSESCTLVKL